MNAMLSLFLLALALPAHAATWGPAVQAKKANDGSCAVPASYWSGYNPFADESLDAALVSFEHAVAASTAGMQGGFSLGLVYGQELVWSKGYGLIDQAAPARGPPTKDTGFRIGSITKVFTTLMMMRLREQGRLDPQTPLTKALSGFSIGNPFGGPGPTLDQLTAHLGGMPREMPCDFVYSQGCVESPETLLQRIANLTLLTPPGTQPSYSNLGFGLLGRAMEEAAGLGWEEYVEREIVSGLGMNNTGNDCAAAAKVGRLAVGYTPAGVPQGLPGLGYCSPAGQMYSSVADLARLATLVFRNADLSSSVLQPQTLREWLEPMYINPDGSGFGRCWELANAGDYTIYGKNGDINGYTAVMLLVPSLRLAFIALQASDDSPSLLAATTAFTTGLLPAIADLVEEHDPAPALPPSFSSYLGTYAMDYPGIGTLLFNVTVGKAVRSTVLFLTSQLFPLPTPLAYQGNDTFMMTLYGVTSLPCEAREGGMLQHVRFSRQASGVVTSLTLPGICYNCVAVRQS